MDEDEVRAEGGFDVLMHLVEDDNEVVVITRDGQPVAVMISADRAAALQEELVNVQIDRLLGPAPGATDPLVSPEMPRKVDP